MKLKVVVCLLAFLSFSAASAFAQDFSKIDIFAGYSYVRENPATSSVNGSNLHGGSASVAYNANHWLGAVADFGGYHSNNVGGGDTDGTVFTYLFGPRFSYRKYERVTPFAQTLFGVAHGSASVNGGLASTNNAFAASFGGGVDVKITRSVSFRAAQVEYLLTRFPEISSGRQTQNNLRVSTGIVLHF